MTKRTYGVEKHRCAERWTTRGEVVSNPDAKQWASQVHARGRKTRDSWVRDKGKFTEKISSSWSIITFTPVSRAPFPTRQCAKDEVHASGGCMQQVQRRAPSLGDPGNIWRAKSTCSAFSPEAGGIFILLDSKYAFPLLLEGDPITSKTALCQLLWKDHPELKAAVGCAYDMQKYKRPMETRVNHREEGKHILKAVIGEVLYRHYFIKSSTSCEVCIIMFVLYQLH